MRRQSLLWRLAAASAGLLALVAVVSAQTAEVHLGDDSVLSANSPAPAGHLPVLFVHGHNPNDEVANPNYRKDWQDPLGGLPSFRQVLELAENNGLAIEPYYIRFLDQNRSITEDAGAIGDAIDLILHRHDPSYDYPHNAAQTTHVQVVIIAYSKGTISSRQYLKSLQTERPGFHPVSEFIAIAPPNHGISTNLFALTQSLAVKQLYNGYRPQGIVHPCGESFNTPAATDYIELLNGHPIEDTLALDATDVFPSEAPGSRADTDPATGAPHPLTDGTLYVTIFANGSRDLVGGDAASADCQGRTLALNLASDAVNIPVAAITGGNDAAAVHQNTVHTAEVMCLALYAAVHHRSPLGRTCALVGGVPVIPPPARAAAMLTLDFSGSMSASTSGGDTRAGVLKDAVELFVQLWLAVSVPSDRLGVTYFRTNVDQFALNGETLLPLSTGSAGINGDVQMQMPGNSTAMGNGLQRSIETLRDSAGDSQVRRVILFTDGMQNVNPMARIVNGQLQFVNEPGRPNSNVSPTAPAALDPSLGIAVDTIGIGAGEDFVGLLQDISAATGGHTLVTTAPDDLRRFFIEQLINALRGFSPQLVAYRHGNIGPAGSIEAFAIEEGAHRVVLKVSWQRGQRIDFTVARNGVDVTSAGHFIDGAFYKIFVIDLPAKGRGPINARGNWQILIKGKAATAYQAAAIVDGGRITYDAVFNAKRPKVGDPLDLVVRFAADRQPIGSRARITVTLMSPTRAIRDIIATTQPNRVPALEPGMTIAERQLIALSQDRKMWAALKPRQQTLLLKRTEKGDFRARFRPQVPGIYTAFVTIEGDAAKLGQFSRTLTATTVVHRKKTLSLKPR